MIQVYRDRKDRINKTLATFPFDHANPQALALLNHDTPVASLVAELGKVEEQLVEAEGDLASAYKDKRAIELGVFGRVAAWFPCTEDPHHD